ncbi:hypothetical protein MRB53_041449 [Persea americana]|nr:hypothetical protein MRB53_041449 [Persea americana]
MFFDFLTKILDGAVRPVPILQSVNMFIAVVTLAYEWPLPLLAGTTFHKSIELRMFWLPLATMSSVLMYQGTNVALYYFVATAAYFWAYTEGEVICAEPWTLPKRIVPKSSEKA